MGANIPLPALAVQPPQDPTQQLGKILQLKALMQQQQFQQQLMPGELQEQQQRLKQGAQQVQSGAIDLQTKQDLQNMWKLSMEESLNPSSSDSAAASPKSGGASTPTAAASQDTAQASPGSAAALLPVAGTGTPSGSPAASPGGLQVPRGAPSNPGDDLYQRILQKAATAGISGPAVQAWSQQYLTMQKQYLSNTLDQQKVIDAQLAQQSNLLNPIVNAGQARNGEAPQDAFARGKSMWDQTRAQVASDPTGWAQKIGQKEVQYLLGNDYPGPQGAETLLQQAEGMKAFTDNAKSVADTQETLAKLPGTQAESQQNVLKTQAMTSWLAAHPGKTAADYATAQAANTAGAEAAARFPYEKNIAMVREQINNQFWNNKDAIGKVETQVLAPYQQKLQSVAELNSAIDQANAGNITAPRAVLLKLIGVSNPDGTKRYNSQEAERLASMGNVPQRFLGTAESLLTGDQWTPKMAADMKSFGDAQAQVANNSANAAIDNINTLHNLQGPNKIGHFTLPKSAELQTSPAASAGNGTSVTAPDGSVHQFPDQKSADAFKRAAGIQ